MLRYLENEDKIKSRELYEEVFEDTDKFTDFYFKEYLNKNQIIANIEESEIISMMHLNPNHITIKGEDNLLCYIFAVATKPEYRKKGYMEGMMTKAIIDLYEEEMPFCYLIPEKAKTYIKYGFCTIRERSVAIANTRKMEYDVDDFCFRKFEENDSDILIKFFNKAVASKSEVYKTRSADYFSNMKKKLESENGDIELLFIKDEIAGYAYVSNEEEVLVPEIECEYDNEKYLLSYIGEKYNVESARKISPELMLRVLRPEKMVKYINSDSELKVNIKIKDSIIDKNSGVFSLRVDNKKGELVPIDEKEELEMDIMDFGKWIFGKLGDSYLPKINYIKEIHMNEIL